MSTKNLLNEDIRLINVGNPNFRSDFERQNILFVHLEWRPKAGGDEKLLAALKKIRPFREKIQAANDKALERMQKAEGVLIGIKKAIDVIPDMDENTILHSGPPIAFDDMAGPMQGAIVGALLYEGKAKDHDEAYEIARSGKIRFDSAHHHDAVGPMAGIISPSMPVHVLKDSVHGNQAYCTVNEGLGKVLRYGANSQEVIDKLKWLETTYMPIVDAAINQTDGIDIKSIITQALHMGDECHNRNKASSALFLREVAPLIAGTDVEGEKKREVIAFIKENEHSFLNLSMPYAKLATMCAHGIEYSTIITAMSRNGVNFGIRLSGSDTWYEAPANYVEGLLFPGFTMDDAAPDIGDSSITETAGIGGFAMGGAPAIVKFVGSQVQKAFDYSKEMHEITHAKHGTFTLAPLDFMPTALGIDPVKVIETNILPIINTGMAHKDAGVGQVGAGLVHPPKECFEDAILDLAERLEEKQ